METGRSGLHVSCIWAWIHPTCENSFVTWKVWSTRKGRKRPSPFCEMVLVAASFDVDQLANSMMTLFVVCFSTFDWCHNCRSADMWGLGCLIWEVFNGSLPRTGALKSLGKVLRRNGPQFLRSRFNILSLNQFDCSHLDWSFILDSKELGSKLLWAGRCQPEVAAESCKVYWQLQKFRWLHGQSVCPNHAFPWWNSGKFFCLVTTFLAITLQVCLFVSQFRWHWKMQQVSCFFQIKDQVEKIEFFNSLSPVLDTFPEAFCKHKILPQLVNAFEFGNAGSSILAPLFKVCSKLILFSTSTKSVKHFVHKQKQAGVLVHLAPLRACGPCWCKQQGAFSLRVCNVVMTCPVSWHL